MEISVHALFGCVTMKLALYVFIDKWHQNKDENKFYNDVDKNLYFDMIPYK